MPTPPTVTILSPQTRSIDKTPQFRWSTDVTDQSQYKIAVYSADSVDADVAMVYPASGAVPELHAGLEGLRQYFQFPYALPTGRYNLHLQAYSQAYGWSADTVEPFQIVPYAVHTLEYDYNKFTTGADGGFEDWPGQAQIDLSGNPTRVRVAELSPLAYTTGTFDLLFDSGFEQTNWSTLSYNSLEQSGATVTMAGAVSDTLDALADPAFGGVIPNGSEIDEKGRYIKIRVTLTPSPDALITPHLYSLQLLYHTPEQAGNVASLAFDKPDWSNPANPKSRWLTFQGTVADATGVHLTSNGAVVTYVTDPGQIVLRHDARMLAEYVSLTVTYDLPTDGVGLAQAEVFARAFNRTKNADAAPWVSLGALNAGGTATETAMGDISFCNGKRYVDIKVAFMTTDERYSVKARKVALVWNENINLGEAYYYTTAIYTGAYLDRAVLVAQADVPDGCDIFYRVSSTGTREWEQMEDLPPEAWHAYAGESDGLLRVAARLVSGSTTEYPRISGLDIETHFADGKARRLSE